MKPAEIRRKKRKSRSEKIVDSNKKAPDSPGAFSIQNREDFLAKAGVRRKQHKKLRFKTKA